MAEKKLTPKQWYRKKVNWIIESGYEEIHPLNFYRELFPAGSFEKKGELLDRKNGGKPNGIIAKLNIEDGRKQRIVTDDLEEIKNSFGEENVIISPISYEGKTRRTINARYLYALTFDLDGQEMQQLKDTFHEMKNDVLPKATYVVYSGHGLHLYYFLKEPLRLTTDVIRELNKMKTGLTLRIWNSFTSLEDPQFQPIMQGFRMVGSASKLGKRYPVRAFKYSGKRFTIKELNEYIPDITKEWRAYRIDLRYVSKTPINQAKELWPEWYKKRIIEGKRAGRWYVKRALYDWWLTRLHREIKVGHRYFAIMTLAIFAKKCGIQYDELKKDAYALLEPYDDMTEKEDNHFTVKDIKDALQAFKEPSVNYPRDMIGKFTGLNMPVNKRNFRKQSEHLILARGIKEIKKKMGEVVEGRPKGSGTKEEIVKKWRMKHPEGKKIECEKETGLSRHTVLKWWN